LGGLVAEVVRVGDTVRRRPYPGMDVSFGEAVLARLAAVEFPGAPRFLGYDDEGRQVLTFVAGSVREGPLADADLAALFGVIRRFHELTGGSVVHGDLAPRNTVWPSDGSAPVLIDWDLCAVGRPIEDVAHAVWQCCGLGPSSVVDDAARRVRVAVEAYGLGDAGRRVLFDEVVAWQERCAGGIEERAAEGHLPWVGLVERGAVADVRAAAVWVVANRSALDAAVG
jgi:hypothetical protein